MSEYKESLIALRAKIGKLRNWCKYHYALDSTGTPVKPEDSSACKFCLSGAIQALRVDQGISDNLYVNLATALQRDGHIGLIHFNDTHTHVQVVKYLDEQIAKAD